MTIEPTSQPAPPNPNSQSSQEKLLKEMVTLLNQINAKLALIVGVIVINFLCLVFYMLTADAPWW